MKRFVILGIAMAVVAGAAGAGTWHVEKDGSGDFTVIQDALDAAASGDTLRIGPGRFDDYRIYTTNGGDREIYAKVEVSSLTVIGSGEEATVIGPVEYSWQDPEPASRGIHYIAQPSTGMLQIRDLAIENMVVGLYVENAGSVDAEHVRFTGGRDGIGSVEPTRIVECSFDGMSHMGGWVQGAAGVQVIRSTFRMDNAVGFQVEYCSGMEIRDCSVTSSSGTSGGIGVFGSTGGVYDCAITGFRGGIEFADPNGNELIGNRIDATYTCIISSSESLVVRDNVLQGGSGPVIDFHAQGLPHTITNNHILRGSDLAVNLRGDFYAPPDYHVDMTGNWWGTTDAALIAEWIFDGSDTVGPPLETIIDFEPFLDGPVPADKSSLGSLKSLFR